MENDNNVAVSVYSVDTNVNCSVRQRADGGK
jgi:hypothetical protein